MYLPFGLRLEDDSAFTREVPGIYMTTPNRGVEVGLELAHWSARQSTARIRSAQCIFLNARHLINCGHGAAGCVALRLTVDRQRGPSTFFSMTLRRCVPVDISIVRAPEPNRPSQNFDSLPTYYNRKGVGSAATVLRTAFGHGPAFTEV